MFPTWSSYNALTADRQTTNSANTELLAIANHTWVNFLLQYSSLIERNVINMDADRAREVLKGYLSKRFRVEISDGRIIEGSFVCTDRDRNIVLSNCEEFYGRHEMGEERFFLFEHARLVSKRHVIFD